MRRPAQQVRAEAQAGRGWYALLARGFTAYAIWRFVQAVAEREDAGEGEAKGAAKKWGKRAGYVGRGLVYAALTASTVKILVGSGGGQSQTGKAHKTTAVVLSWPVGTWLVGIAGAVILGVGLWNLYRGLSRKFEDRWRAGEMHEQARKWGARAGVVGHVARAVVFSLIGIFLVKAAIDFNPKDAIGLDGALRKFAADAMSFGIKDLVHRTRPADAHPQIHPLYVVHSSSFPAGHAATAFAGALLLSYMAPRAAPLFVLLATAIGYSRVYVGVHYPGDVVAGALVGVLCGLVAILVLWTLQARRLTLRSVLRLRPS